ncbi:TetR/AcrR family transcriptional regulator [Arthrobacter sp. H14-L1]|uniref:TetR/AcrR family transcriptional regulator n=1 Tax=Arthrobacter sp. H14-L1 TaxID=2996697 RepID=UPI00226DE2DC|nr:TetR/AcrR family transcriptional regulator [Arthrobacter sp. H14-L1]MCY0905611.1 TetR/AcrR family transcriptional regulator [Arthrobacter sp. H14-L1]
MSEPAHPAQSRRPARTNATRQKLFDASMLLIGERGPASVTVDEIAAAAGVSKGTVYYNFGSKSEMIAALLEHGVEMLESRLVSLSPAAKAVDDLQEMLGAMLDFFAEYPSFAQLLVSEMWRTPGEWHETLTLLRERLVGVIGGAVERVAQENQVDTEITPASVAGAILGATFVIGLDRLVFHPDRSREQALAVVMTVIRGYLR